MGFLNNFGGGGSMWWIIILLLLSDDGCINTCDSLVWILLLSRFCGGDDCGCPGTTRSSGCGCGCN